MGQSRAKTVDTPSQPATTPAEPGHAISTDPVSTEPVFDVPSFEPWRKPASLSARGWAILGGLVLLVQLPILHRFLLRDEQPTQVSLTDGYQQDFSDGSVVRREFWSTGGDWRVVSGELLSPGVKNNPLWLQGTLPRDVVIEFDARSESPEGDIKVEIFGDGLNHQSGYVLIHGGWKNQLSIIARLDEHGIALGELQKRVVAGRRELRADTPLRVEAHPFEVTRGKTYRWRIERRGGLLRWFIDDALFMQYDDPFPLAGPGHDRFGFSSWESQLYFDNLSIRPL